MNIKRLIKTIILLIWIISSATAQEVNYLRFTALEDNVEIGIQNDSKLKFTFEYSINGDGKWVEFDTTKTITLPKQDDFISFRGENNKLATSGNKYANFVFSKNVAASGSVMSLISYKDGLPTTIPANYFFCKLFLNCSTLVSAPDLTAETLTQNCYNSMFQGCTSLEQAPNISATSYEKGCMNNMFVGCISLKQIEVSFTSWKTPAGDNFTSSWLKDASESGIFKCPIELDLSSKTASTILKTWLVNPHKISFNNIEQESISIKEDTIISYNGTVKFKISNKKGYENIVTILGKNSQTEIDFATSSTGIYSFTMPNEDVEIKLNYNPIIYTITPNEYITCNTQNATVESEPILFTVADRTSEGYELNKVTINTEKATITNNAGSFLMSDFAKDVTIKATYTPIKYNISKDDNISCRKTTGTVNDTIRFTIKDLTSKGYAFKTLFINNVARIPSTLADSVIMAQYLCDVKITTEYEPINLNITHDEYITCNTQTATVESEEIPFSVADRTAEGYSLSKVNINTKLATITDYAGSFLMSDFAKDVTIKASYIPIKYNITKDKNITCQKTTATVEDEITFTIKNLTSSGLILSKVFVNSQEVNFQDYSASFKMADYISDVNISAEYQHLDYKITTDENCVANQQFANIDDLIKITAADLTNSGYELKNIFVNGKSITFYKNFCNFMMSDYKSDVEVTTQYKPITYKVKTGNNVYSDNNTAIVSDTILFTVDDLSEKGKIFEGILVNGQQIDIEGFNDTIFMSDYISDINIEALYSKYNSITTDNNVVEISHTTAQQGDLITFKINKALAGYEPMVYVNSRSLSSPDSVNYSFSMFNNDVNIYVEYQEIVIEEPDTQDDNDPETEPEIIKKKKPTALNKVKTYPSLAKEGEIITISLENIDSEYLTDSKIIICNITGKVMKTIDNPQGMIKLTLPLGLYKGVLISGDKKFKFDFLITK